MCRGHLAAAHIGVSRPNSQVIHNSGISRGEGYSPPPKNKINKNSVRVWDYDL